MYFIAMVAQLELQNAKLALSPANGVHAHAAFLNAVSTHNPELGAYLHNMQRNKCFTIALLPQNRTRALLRFTFMDKEASAYVNALVTSGVLHGDVRLGDQFCTITDLSLAHLGYTGVATWGDICKPTCHRHITIVFNTPTAINKQTGEGKRFASLYPEAEDIFLGLVRRWHGLLGPALPASLEQYLVDHGCVVAGHELRTVQFKTRERTQIGFTGRVTYECMTGDEECITALNWLTRLAFYTGIGYQTARGMGAVRIWLQDEAK